MPAASAAGYRREGDGDAGRPSPDCGALVAPASRKRCRAAAAGDVPVLHPADRRPLRLQLPARLDRRGQRHVLDLVLWGAAFVLRERDEVRFDIIYSS